MGRFGGEPDDVAKTIERAIKARRPRTRYPVTPSARIVLLARRLPHGADAMVARVRLMPFGRLGMVWGPRSHQAPVLVKGEAGDRSREHPGARCGITI